MKLFNKTIEDNKWEFRTLTISKTIFGKFVIEILLKRYGKRLGCDDRYVILKKQIFFLKTDKEGLFDALYILNTKYPEFELNDYLNNTL